MDLQLLRATGWADSNVYVKRKCILTVSGIGSVTVRASQAGNLHFLPAADVEQTFNIPKAPTSTLTALLELVVI